jgi:hypothetical protein
MFPGYDRWKMGGDYSIYPVDIVCADCGHEWFGSYATEYGAGWLEPHEECPNCGADGDALSFSDAEPPDAF